MLFLGIFYYLISLFFTVASALKSIGDREYYYENKGEAVVVGIFIVLFCWLTIPAELFYFFVREDSENNKVSYNYEEAVYGEEIIYQSTKPPLKAD